MKLKYSNRYEQVETKKNWILSFCMLLNNLIKQLDPNTFTLLLYMWLIDPSYPTIIILFSFGLICSDNKQLEGIG